MPTLPFIFKWMKLSSCPHFFRSFGFDYVLFWLGNGLRFDAPVSESFASTFTQPEIKMSAATQFQTNKRNIYTEIFAFCVLWMGLRLSISLLLFLIPFPIVVCMYTAKSFYFEKCQVFKH